MIDYDLRKETIGSKLFSSPSLMKHQITNDGKSSTIISEKELKIEFQDIKISEKPSPVQKEITSFYVNFKYI